MARNITKRQAEAAFKAVCERFGVTPDDRSLDAPKLYPPGFHCNGWAIAWESGTDWAFDLDGVKFPKGVWTEPYASWCLALYPAS